MDHIIEAERQKYTKLFHGSYGHGYHGKAAHELLSSTGAPLRILDVGCGHNEFIEARRHLGDFAIGCDIAAPRCDIRCASHELPFRNRIFDFVTCFDVLEHLPSEYIDPTLEAMAACSKQFLFSICYIASIPPEPCLHLTVKPQEWWIKKIQNFGTVEDTGIQSGHHLSGHYLKGKWFKQ